MRLFKRVLRTALTAIILTVPTSLQFTIEVETYQAFAQTSQQPKVKRMDLGTEIVACNGKKVSLVNDDQLIEKGVEVMEKIVSSLPSQTNQRIGMWYFGVIPIENACGQHVVSGGLTGGFVVVGRKLLEEFSSDAIAFIIAHEIAHVTLGHSGVPNLGTDLFSKIGTTLLWFPEEKLAREQEITADKWALIYMQKACFNVAGAIEYLESLGWISKIAGKLPNSTHPSPSDRLDNINKFAKNPIACRSQASIKGLTTASSSNKSCDLKGSQVNFTQWGWDNPLAPENMYISSKGCFLDDDYLKEEERYHLGIDLMTGGGIKDADVYSICDGKIVETNPVPLKKADNSRIVIECNTGRSGAFYVIYGHVKKTSKDDKCKVFKEGEDVQRGDCFAKIADQGSNSHLHLGINNKKEIYFYKVGEKACDGTNIKSPEGWGRAKSCESEETIAKKGYVDPALYFYENNFIGDTKGLATALVMDVSGSMGSPSGRKAGERKIDAAIEAAESFIDCLDPASYSALSTFSSSGKIVVNMSPQSVAKDTLKKEISQLTPGGSTNMADGLDKAHDELESDSVSGAKKAVVLLSDGMHNVGPWSNVTNVVNKFANKRPKWKIFTIGFGKNIDEAKLTEISGKTGGYFYPPIESDIIKSPYRLFCSWISGESTPFATSEYLSSDGKLSYNVPISQGAERLKVATSWQGSKLETTLISPTGQNIKAVDLTGNLGRYEEGDTYQIMVVENPEGGTWGVQLRWAEPPPKGERVNLSISEKTDILANILGFKSKYKLGEGVDISVHGVEIAGFEETPLKNAKVIAKILKPGRQMIQTILAKGSKFTMFKDVLLNNTREIVLYDDGGHNDYKAGDGIFSNTFIETDKNGAYLVTVIISGEKKDGQEVNKTLKGFFQVGEISKNVVTTSQTLNFLNKDYLQEEMDISVPSLLDSLGQPDEDIDMLLSNDPADSIDKLLELGQ